MNPARTSTPALFDDNPPAEPTAGRFTLWYKGDARRSGWEPVAHTATEFEAVMLIGTGGRHGGRWQVLPVGREP